MLEFGFAFPNQNTNHSCYLDFDSLILALMFFFRIFVPESTTKIRGIPYCIMKDRIYQIMKESGMNQKEFSQTTGIAPATLSSIFNGRTSATLNHAQALHQRFPTLRMEWLMFGEGQMYKDGSNPSLFERSDAQSSLEHANDEFPTEFSFPIQPRTLQKEETEGESISSSVNQVQPTLNRMVDKLDQMAKYLDKPQRKVVEVRIYFDDGTYEVFSGPTV